MDTFSSQISPAVTVKATCKSKASYNNNGQGLCEASPLVNTVSLDYDTTDPAVTVRVTSHTEITNPVPSSVTVNYQRRATPQPPLLCFHSEFLDGSWTARSTTWPTGKSLVQNTSVNIDYNIDPNDLAGVNELRFDALCIYANGDTASSEGSVPVNIPVIVDISINSRLIACNRPSDGTPQQTIITYSRTSGTATSCDYTTGDARYWTNLPELTRSSRVVVQHGIPHCSTLGLHNVGDSTDITYQVRCYPGRDSRSSDHATLRVVKIDSRVPSAPTIPNSYIYYNSHYYFLPVILSVPTGLHYEWRIAKNLTGSPYTTGIGNGSRFRIYSVPSGRIQADTEYKIEARARNDNGYSNWGEPFIIKTPNGLYKPDDGLLNGFRFVGHTQLSTGTHPNIQAGDFFVQTGDIDGTIEYRIRRHLLYPTSASLRSYQTLFSLNDMLNRNDWLGWLPSQPTQQDGKVFYNTSDSKLYYGVGSLWKEVKPQALTPPTSGDQTGGAQGSEGTPPQI